MKHKIICGHVLDVLKAMPDESIDTIVTSPPYWGLRDYGEETNTIWGGDPNCEHEWIVGITNHDNLRPSKVSEKTIVGSNKELRFRTDERVKNALCAKCGAWYGQLGLEPTLDLYIEHLVDVMRELKRVLKKTGVIFWNHADSYGGSGEAGGDYKKGGLKEGQPRYSGSRNRVPAKCMALQNYRFILRCVDELGLILRNVIIWYKPNHMPSSVKDRFTSSYEPVFMLVKNRNYWFDLDAVRLPHKESSRKRVLRAVSNKHKYLDHPEYSGGGGINKPRPNRRKLSIKFFELFDKPDREYHREQNMAISQCVEGDYLAVNLHPLGVNPGDVWTIPTQPFPEAHFATFGEKLVEPMIKAGCPRWICKKCGKARVRITRAKKTKGTNNISELRKQHKDYLAQPLTRYETIHYTIGWTDCGCNVGWEAGLVLDPFGGSGTVGVVAEQLGRNSILIDLNKEYCEMAYRRIKKIAAQTKLGEEPSIIERVGF